VAASSTITKAGEAARQKPDSEKARRIVEAMRASVAARGAPGSTFDQVAREAGVSRGLLHYYFGSKERLLVEVVRHDCDVRMDALEQSLSAAGSVDAIVDVLVKALEDFVELDPGSYALVFELFTASRHNNDLREAMGELYRRVRDQIAAALRAKQEQGAVELRGRPEAVASVLMALADGMALQLLSDPDWDSSEAFAAGIATARFLLGEDA
jgi:AcrR family transcriptional regulator